MGYCQLPPYVMLQLLTSHSTSHICLCDYDHLTTCIDLKYWLYCEWVSKQSTDVLKCPWLCRPDRTFLCRRERQFWSRRMSAVHCHRKQLHWPSLSSATHYIISKISYCKKLIKNILQKYTRQQRRHRGNPCQLFAYSCNIPLFSFSYYYNHHYKQCSVVLC